MSEAADKIIAVWKSGDKYFWDHASQLGEIVRREG
jgi:hypothetical protein